MRKINNSSGNDNRNLKKKTLTNDEKEKLIKLSKRKKAKQKLHKKKSECATRRNEIKKILKIQS